MTDTKALQELLEAAIDLEEKAADLLERPLTPDAREDLEAQSAAAEAGDPDAIAALSQRLEVLHSQLAAMTGQAPEPAAGDEAAGEKAWGDFDDDAPGMDFEEPDEVKAFCGHGDRDEFADGSVVCADCGTALEAKADEDADPADELPGWAMEQKSAAATSVLSELEILRAQRAAAGL